MANPNSTALAQGLAQLHAQAKPREPGLPAPSRLSAPSRMTAAGREARTAGRSPATEADLAAFARENLDRAVRVAWRLVGGDHGAAEDIVQEALLAAHRALPRFRGDAKLETWFFRILYRKASNYRRWRALRLPFDGDLESVLGDSSRLARTADAEIAQRVDEALAQLSAPQRGAFVLVHLEGFTTAEAAASMGKAHGTVKSHLHRALRSMRAQLADLNPGDGTR